MRKDSQFCLYGSERGELLAVFPVLECDGMKPLLGPADIHTADAGTRLAVIHSDSRAKTDSRYSYFFLNKEVGAAAMASGSLNPYRFSARGSR